MGSRSQNDCVNPRCADSRVVVMRYSNTEDMIKIVSSICEKKGIRLTETRQHVLEVLFKLDIPVSAYELTEQYNLHIDSPIMAMSVYRILDFLESIRLVYHLHSINKYIICHHVGGISEQHPPHFLICKSCHHIQEFRLATELVAAFSIQVENAGFLSVGSQIELNSLCEKCKSTIKLNCSGDIHD
jgi:Fur family zinc uptake transcriptional regulator